MAKRRRSQAPKRRAKRKARAKASYQFVGDGPRPEASAKRQRPGLKRSASIAGHAIRIAMVLVAVVGFLGLVLFARLTQDLPDTSQLFAQVTEPAITVLDVNDEKIGTRGLGHGSYVHLSELPRSLILAVLAVEDRKFYRHMGIDLEGLVRAAFTNMEEGHVVQGGSTISQQLAKILFLSPERTYKRKLQEALLALWLEHKLTKDEILEIYLNRVYLGAGTVGVEAASERYFGKPAHDLSLVESAMLAGLLKAPSYYAPTASIERADERTALVLDLMVEANFISPQERAQARDHPARILPATASGGADYVLDWVISRLPDFVGKPREDLIVQTSIDMRLQRAAEAALDSGLDKDGPALHASEGALVAMKPDGAVTAMIGGRSYADSPFNRAVDARRPPGSAFKPFVYLAAIEAGYRPDTPVTDEPIRIGSWQPSNYTGRFIGPTTIENAFAQSINTVAARLGEAVGRSRIIQVARRFGISSPLEPVPSLALGSEGVGLMELTAAYAPFANGGDAVIPYAIVRVQTKSGRLLYERQGSGPVADLDSIGLMNQMMTQVVEAGTGRAAQIPGQITAGKTGTGQDHRDAWFVGFTTHMVAGIWVGNDDFSPMKEVTGGSLPAHIFKSFMTVANDGRPSEALPGTAMPEMPAMPPEGLTAASEPRREAPSSEDSGGGIGALFRGIARVITGKPSAVN